MKKLVVLFCVSFLLIACKTDKKDVNVVEEVTVEPVAYISFGEKITDKDIASKTKVIEMYKNLKIGDTIDVKMEAKVNKVCQTKGCWMRLDLDNDEVMVKFKDYGFFMPKNIAEKDVIVSGKAFVSEVSVSEQRHYAEDAGKTEDEIAAITEPEKTLSFVADGVLLKE